VDRFEVSEDGTLGGGSPVIVFAEDAGQPAAPHDLSLDGDSVLS
jgi:hypothetical protein